MKKFSQEMIDKIRQKKPKIVFPEATDERILLAIKRLINESLVQPIFLGDEEVLTDKMSEFGIDKAKCQIINPQEYEDINILVEKLYERRAGKISYTEAKRLITDPLYFGPMLVYMKLADGMIIGANTTTSHAVVPVLQIIKKRPDVKKISGVYFMLRGKEKYLFADCAINILPSSEDLAEIALESAKTARICDIDPRVALLSFSTKGSAHSADTKRVIEAVNIAKQRNPSVKLDGELQFDAAFVPYVAEKKAPKSEVKGDANVFVFPNLEAGNIAYKIAERLAGFDAVGPILQGLKQPVNLLSRGCNADDVYRVAIITSAQTIE